MIFALPVFPHRFLRPQGTCDTNHSLPRLKVLRLEMQAQVKAMNSVRRVSDEEVFLAILYLDPDFQDALERHEARQSKSQFRFWVKLAFVILSIAAILYFTTLRYLPAIVRLLS